MTKHSLCIRDHGQTPRSRLEDVCGPTLYPDTNLLSASAHFHGNRKERGAGSWDNCTTTITAALPHYPLKQWATPNSWHPTYCGTCCFPRHSLWLTECAWVSTMLWNLLSAFSTNGSCPPTRHMSYVQFSMERKRWNFHHQHMMRQPGHWGGLWSPIRISQV